MCSLDNVNLVPLVEHNPHQCVRNMSEALGVSTAIVFSKLAVDDVPNYCPIIIANH